MNHKPASGKLKKARALAIRIMPTHNPIKKKNEVKRNDMGFFLTIFYLMLTLGTCQMSLLYCLIVRSELNSPMRATFKMDLCVHSFLSE